MVSLLKLKYSPTYYTLFQMFEIFYFRVQLREMKVSDIRVNYFYCAFNRQTDPAQITIDNSSLRYSCEYL